MRQHLQADAQAALEDMKKILLCRRKQGLLLKLLAAVAVSTAVRFGRVANLPQFSVYEYSKVSWEAPVVGVLLEDPETNIHELRIQHANNQITYSNVSWETPAFSVITPVLNATIVSSNGGVVNASGIYDFGKWYWKREQNPKPRTPKRTIVSYPVLTLVQIYNGEFQHIIFDTLPKLTFVCPFLERHLEVKVVVENPLQQDLVVQFCPALTNPHNRFLRYDSKSPLWAPIVYVPYFGPASLGMGVIPPNSMHSLGSQQQQAAATDVIYIPRQAGTKRSVANEAQVLATLRAKWPQLRIFYPANDWSLDRDAFYNATVIIAPHGGALSNMIFAARNATILEFTPLVQFKLEGKNERPCFFGLAHGLGFQYHAISPSTFDFDKGSMVVPTQRLEDILRHVRV